MNTTRRELVKTGLYLIVGSSLFLGGLWRSCTYANAAPPGPGAKIPKSSITSDKGETIEVAEGQWTLVVAGPVEFRVIAERAANWAAFSIPSKLPLRVIYLSEGRHPSGLIGVSEYLRSAFSERQLARIGIPRQGPRVLLVGPDLRITFASHYAKLKDIDLLLRKYVGQFPSAGPPTLQSLDITDVRGAAVNFETLPTDLFVFHRACTSCSQEAGFAELTATQGSIQKHCAELGHRCFLLLEESLATEDLEEYLAETELRLPALITKRTERILAGSSVAELTQPFVAHFRSDGQLDGREQLHDFIERFSGASDQTLGNRALAVSRIARIDAKEGKAVVLDAEGHQLLYFDNRTIVRRIGSIGNGPGEFYYPSDFQITSDGGVAVLDGGNSRIQLLDSQGNLKAEVHPSTKPMGLAVVPTGDVHVGEPAAGALVSVYSQTGQLRFRYGTLLEDPPRSTSARKRLGIDRVHLRVDSKGNVWTAFLHRLLVRRYSPNGVLQVEVDLGKVLEPDLAGSGHHLPQLNFDGEQLPVLIQDASYHRDLDSLWLLLGDGRLVVLESEGTVIKFHEPTGGFAWARLAAIPGLPQRVLLAEQIGGRINEEPLRFNQPGKAEKGK